MIAQRGQLSLWPRSLTLEFIDIHTHRPEQVSGVLAIRNVDVDYGGLPDGSHLSVGIHPGSVTGAWMPVYEMLRSAAASPSVRAIGECGLDKVVSGDLTLQLAAFRAQVALAGACQKPLIIHCVRAYEEVLAALSALTPGVPVIFHGYRKGAALAARLASRGYRLSFGAALLRPAEGLVEALHATPLSHLFLETDADHYSIELIYEAAARILGLTVARLKAQIHDNACTINIL